MCSKRSSWFLRNLPMRMSQRDSLSTVVPMQTILRVRTEVLNKLNGSHKNHSPISLKIWMTTQMVHKQETMIISEIMNMLPGSLLSIRGASLRF